LGVSRDLKGFHLYGLDLCILAKIRGYAAYVVDFHLSHLGIGKIDVSFHECKRNMIKKYAKVFSGNFYQTPCTSFYMSSINLLNKIMNYRHVHKQIIKYYKKKNMAYQKY